MIPLEALKLALSKEIESITLYKRLGVDHPGLRDVFDFLIIEEERHKKLMEGKIQELTKF